MLGFRALASLLLFHITWPRKNGNFQTRANALCYTGNITQINYANDGGRFIVLEAAAGNAREVTILQRVSFADLL
jgi:hypothetical protein